MKLAAKWVGVFGAAPMEAMPDVAQEAEATRGRRGDLRIEEITVTARKREEAAQDVPIAITAVTTELGGSTIRNLADLNAYVPNVMIAENSGRSRGSVISIRGVSPTEFTDKSFDPPVAVALDGVFFGTGSGRIVENFDLERVEILRGPQGTLFGKNTVGGVINIFRSKPTGEFGGKVRATVGSDGQQEFRSLLNFPIGETLAAKVFFTDIAEDGYLDNTTTGGEGPEKDYKNFGLTLLWTPFERFDAMATWERYDDRSDTGAFANYNVPAGFFPVPPPGALGAQDLSAGFYNCNVLGSCRTSLAIPGSYETNTHNDSTYRNDVFSLTMNYEINENLSLVSVTGYHDTPVEDVITELDGSKDLFIWIDNDNEYEQFTQELRLEGSNGGFDWVLGAYYLDSEYTQNWVTFGSFWQIVASTAIGISLHDNAPLFPGGPGATDACVAGAFAPLACDTGVPPGSGLGPNFTQLLFQTQDIESLAFFFQTDYEINDRWNVTFGVRYTDEEKDFLAGQSYLAPLGRERVFNYPDFADLSDDWQETSFKAGVNYQVTDDVMFYASYSEGFKSGGFFGRNQNVSDFERTYEPEFAHSYELGMKGQFFDNRVQLNMAAFYNDFEDKQDSNVVLDVSTGTVATVFENIGGLEYTGAEAELQWLVSDSLSVFATVGYLDAEYDGFFSLNFVDVTLRATTPKQNVDFLTPKNAPDWTLGAGGTYVIPIGPGELSLHARWNFIDELETDTYNGPGTRLESRNFIDAQVSYEWNRMRLTAFGKNLTDEVQEIPFTGVSPWFAYSSVTEGAQYGVELEVEF
jgi:iron complex outermembrane receptor protein